MTRRWRASTRAIHTKLPRGGVVLDPASKAYFTLNETGEALWSALSAPATLEELASMLAREFEVGFETARTDVESWLAELHELGLIDVVGSDVAG
ncbi:HPr-rel-A system PqqD family peptide chaperone [Sandaracinus amylolyticus]|uniref:PqqD family protein n=1 Tax=Sandaracinus amylolyticus TaxID=927083 RepID=A0A0F6SFI0_9BACT|nr:HPr-rel-A system PqqD family peptide chaperone [Sandaracinus amylolyticus]AKF06979.1 hypothetical protein DB32_004128 [Sandaracinus amylolyticus]